jgi:hypothetical protein
LKFSKGYCEYVLGRSIIGELLRTESSICGLLLEPEGLIIRYVDIEEPLLTKVQECITDDDFGYITEVIWKRIQVETHLLLLQHSVKQKSALIL